MASAQTVAARTIGLVGYPGSQRDLWVLDNVTRGLALSHASMPGGT
jgi:hypothetical protein